MTIRQLLIALTAAGLAVPALAQYKVVDPDGRVTYTDRPPVAESAKVMPLGRSGAPTAGATATEGGLPFELRQVATRFPVTLYTGASCTPCEAGRQLLRQRGVPYVERQIVTAEDSAALERLSGGRTIPSLTVGSQALRGFNPTDWSSYLDAAGYPRESRLPRGWAPPPATPLVARAPAVPAATPAPAEPARPAAPAPAETPNPTIRF
jgi:glutaredoxin